MKLQINCFEGQEIPSYIPPK